MKPIRVLYVSGGSLDYGGIAAVMLNYAGEMDPSRVRIDFLVHGMQKGPREAEAEQLGAKVIHVPYKADGYHANRRAIRDAIVQGEYDIVHAHMDGMNGYVLSLAKKAGVRTRISHAHSAMHLTNSRLKRCLHDMVKRLIPRYATHLFACSQAAARFLYGAQRAQSGEVSLLPNAFSTAAFAFDKVRRADYRDALGIPNDAFVIGHVGNMTALKNQTLLIDVLDLLVKRNENAVLVLVGDGELRASLEDKAARLGLDARIRFTGLRSDLPGLYDAFDLFAFPSLFEGLGIVALEAQCSGLPCVVSPRVPPEALVCDGCMTMADFDPAHWADALRFALRRSDLPERQSAYRRVAKAGYELQTAAERLVDLYARYAVDRPRVLFLQNIPSPYRIDFFNELGRYVDLTVLFEAKTTPFTKFNYNLHDVKRFDAVFLRDGDIREKRVDWRVLRYLKRGAYDSVVATNYAYFTEAAAILALKARRIPYELELDGGVVRNDTPLVHALKRMLIRGAVRYWSTGDATDRFFAYFGVSREKIVRYPFTSVPESYVESRPLTQEEKRAEKRALDLPWARVVLGVGGLSRRKAPDVFLRAAASIKGDVGFVWIGSGEAAAYESLARELGVVSFRMRPFLDGETLKRYYRAADVFVLPTREDVWGLVINEAMASALPVVTTDRCEAGCTLMQDGINGYLVPIDDPNAVAERVQTLLDDAKLRESMAHAALETARQYTIEEMARVHAERLIQA